MDALLQSLRLAQTRLERAGIRSAVIGGLAVAAWGRPRVTDDVDLKVSATRAEAQMLVDVMGPEFRPVPDAVSLAQSIGVLFLEGPGEIRVDLLLADLGFDEHALDRAVEAEIIPGFRATLCTPEDLILYKMITTRARDREDVRSVVLDQGERLDRDYVERWLVLFEQALDDSTLVSGFRELCR